jgi:cytochrome P450
MVHLPAADRDTRSYPVGDAVDPTRATSSHLAFGYGFHRCVGAELARMELRAAYPALARRFPDLALAVPAEDLAYHAKSIVYGVESVPVRLHG